MTIENTDVINPKGRGVYAHSTASGIISDITINGGNWETYNQCLFSYARGHITVIDGHFKSTITGSSGGQLLYEGSQYSKACEIKGGFFDNSSNTCQAVSRYNSSTAAIVVTGGYFTNAVAGTFIADGYGWYSVTGREPYKYLVKAK